MSAIANITLADAAATPVNRVFNPKRVGDGGGNSTVAVWENRAGGIYVGYDVIHLDMSYPTPKRRSAHVRVRMMTPVMENTTNATVSGIAPAPTVSYTPMFDGTFVIPERSTLQARKDLRKMLAAALADPQFIAAIEQLEAPW